jgi:hypothetical protein
MNKVASRPANAGQRVLAAQEDQTRNEVKSRAFIQTRASKTSAVKYGVVDPIGLLQTARKLSEKNLQALASESLC